MAKQRIQVESGIQAPVSRPVAAPVDTYVRPQDSQLEQLAQGLSELHAPLAKFSSVLIARDNAAAQAEGEQTMRQLSDQRVSLNKAMKEGRIPKHANPWFMAGVQEQAGRASATKWSEDFQVALKHNTDVQESINVEDFDKFQEKHREEWLKENVGDNRDGHFEKGYGHLADQWASQERKTWIAGLDKRLEGKADDSHFTLVKAAVRDGIVNKKMAVADIGFDLTLEGQMAVGTRGRNGTAVNQATVDAIVGAALEAPDDHTAMQMLEILKHVNGGSGPLADIKYGTKAFKEAVDEIDKRGDRLDRIAIREERRGRKEAERDVLGEAVKRLTENPAKADLKDLFQRSALYPEVVDNLKKLQDQAWAFTSSTDQGLKQDLLGRIWAPGASQAEVTERTITQQMLAHNLSSEDGILLMGQLRQAREEREKGEKSILSDPDFSMVRGGIAKSFGDLLDMNGTIGDKITATKVALTQQWAELWNSGQAAKMTREERRKWLLDTQRAAVDFQRGPDALKLRNATDPDLNPKNPKVEAKLPKNLRLTEEDLVEYRAGRETDRLTKLFKELGLKSVTERGALIRNQLEMYSKKHGREVRSRKELRQQQEGEQE